MTLLNSTLLVKHQMFGILGNHCSTARAQKASRRWVGGSAGRRVGGTFEMASNFGIDQTASLFLFAFILNNGNNIS